MKPRTAFAIGLTLASVAVGGWKGAIPGLDFAQASTNGTNPIAEASAFTQAAAALAAYHQTAGSYSGATLGPTSPVQLVWATDEQFCLQGTDLHLIGPVGGPQPGPCPPL